MRGPLKQKRKEIYSEAKKKVSFSDTLYLIHRILFYFNLSSEETVSLFLPFALRDARTLLPFGVDILSLKPCLFDLFLLEG